MLVAFITAVAFVVLSICVFSDAPFVMHFDAVVDRVFAPLRTRGWSRFFAVVTFFGSVSGIILATVAVLLLAAWNTRVVELCATAVGGGAIVVQLMKLFTARVRPDPLAWRKQELQYSYPSWHATGVVTLYGILVLLLLPLSTPASIAFVVLYILLVLAVGVSRLALSVHHASDVIGGYLVGTAFLALASALF